MASVIGALESVSPIMFLLLEAYIVSSRQSERFQESPLYSQQSLNGRIPPDRYGRLQYKPGQSSIPVIPLSVAAPMMVQHTELVLRTHLQRHFNFPFLLKNLLKAHQLKLGDFFFNLMGKQTKEFSVYRSGAMATATDQAIPEGRAGSSESGRLASGEGGGCGEGAAGRLLFPLGLWLQDWYTTAFSPTPASG